MVSHQASLDHPLMHPFTITILCEAPETETNSVTGDTMLRPARSTKRPRMINRGGPIVVQFRRTIRSLALSSNRSVTLCWISGIFGKIPMRLPCPIRIVMPDYWRQSDITSVCYAHCSITDNPFYAIRSIMIPMSHDVSITTDRGYQWDTCLGAIPS